MLDPATVMLWPLLHCTTYDKGALPLGASQIRATAQSVTPVTRRFFGAAAVWASAGFALPRETIPHSITPVAFNARLCNVTCGLLFHPYRRRDHWAVEASSRPARDHQKPRQPAEE